ncbi:MAG: LCP family protein [Patescibacteria group bacterium]|nr:LCP family protein [Patescibacteria group bacterium]
MNNFDLKPVPQPEARELKKRFKWRWWEILIVILVGAFIIEAIYFYVVFAQTKKKIFQPRTSATSLVANIGVPKNSLVVDKKNEYQNYTTFLLMGIGGEGHAGGGLADSIQVLVLNNKNNELKIISVPRDLYLRLDECGMAKINEMDQCGTRLWGENGGGDFSKSIVSQVLGMPINYYVKMDFEGFKELINLVGGVDVDVEKAINDQLAGLNIVAGRTHMDGELALAYARTRYTDSDFDRSGRQQKIILAVKDRLLSSDIYLNPFKLYKILSVISDNLVTDLSSDTTFSYLKKSQDFNTAGTYVIDNRKDNLLYSTTSEAGSYILLPVAKDFSEIWAKVKRIIIDK